jgi:hypothetical protein
MNKRIQLGEMELHNVPTTDALFVGNRVGESCSYLKLAPTKKRPAAFTIAMEPDDTAFA